MDDHQRCEYAPLNIESGLVSNKLIIDQDKHLVLLCGIGQINYHYHFNNDWVKRIETIES